MFGSGVGDTPPYLYVISFVKRRNKKEKTIVSPVFIIRSLLLFFRRIIYYDRVQYDIFDVSVVDGKILLVFEFV